MIRIQVTDLESGDNETVEIPPGEYFLVAADPCWVSGTVAYRNGTHVVTIKNHVARPGSAHQLPPSEMPA